MIKNAISLCGISKSYGALCAVNHLSFSVAPGEVVGFLGPNGAGKSTSIRMLLGLIKPDKGKVELFGEAPHIDSLKRIGFLPEERGLYPKMSARDAITYFAKLKGMSGKAARSRAEDLLRTNKLGEFINTDIMRLSKGMAQKVQILSALAHSPDILILDEPFSGLDPLNQLELEKLIRTENERGAAIVFSTHVMEHAERLCDRIVMMAKGKKVFEGSLDDAYKKVSGYTQIATQVGIDINSTLAKYPLDIVRLSEEDDLVWWQVAAKDGQDSDNILPQMIEAGIPIKGYRPHQKRLREVFVSLTSEMEADHA